MLRRHGHIETTARHHDDIREGCMRFPRDRITFTTTHEGHPAPEGFFVLDLKGLDMEGVTKLVIEGAHVRQAREQGEQRQDAAQKLRDLFNND
jgi:hypothetical protein